MSAIPSLRQVSGLLLESVRDLLVGNRLSRRILDIWFTRYARRRAAELDALDSAKAQEQVLLRLVRKAQNTRFGQEHDLARVGTIQDYQRLVPLRDYEAFWKDYWQSSFPRLANLTWPDEIPYFALTSGTTSGATKHIPVSTEMLRSNRKAALTALGVFVNAYPDARLFSGRMFFLGGSTELVQLNAEAQEGREDTQTRRRGEENRTDPSPRPRVSASPRPILAGDLSGIVAREAPGWLRPFVFPPTDLALLSDWDQKVQVLAEHSARLPVTLVSGVPSWLLVLFAKLREVTGKDRLTDIWPSLRVIVHGGTKFDPYRELFKQAVGNGAVRFLETYPCSEGFIAFEDPRHDLLRLVPDHDIFFEFVPVADLGKDKPARHTVSQVEPGVQYAVVVTTCAGLWSYVIGDTVCFERRNPPLLRFTGRTKYYLSAFGEHLISEEVERAVASAAGEMRTPVVDFHVGPLFPAKPGDVGRHLYIVEFAGAPVEPNGFAQFAAELDRGLCRLNDDYRAHRAGDVGMGPPQVWPVVPGAFAAWLRSQGKLGGQHKVPRMDNTGDLTRQLREWMEGQRLHAGTMTNDQCPREETHTGQR